MHILAVSYFFYPFGGQASHWRTRTLHLLAERGHKVTVLRVKKDPNLIKAEEKLVFPENLRVVEVPNLNVLALLQKLRKSLVGNLKQSAGFENTKVEVNREKKFSRKEELRLFFKNLAIKTWVALSFPAGRNVWLWAAVCKGTMLFRKNPPDVVYTICGPQSNVISGWLLSIILGRPLVIDYKDGWTLDENIQKNLTKLHLALATRLERKALKRANILIGVTDGLIESYQCLYPRESLDKWCLITHGFDASELKPLRKPIRSWSPPLQLTYAATRLNGPSYSLNKFLKAIKLVNTKGRKVHLTCIGKPNGADVYADSLGLTDEEVSFHGTKPKQFVLEAYQDADAVVMILNNTNWNKKKYTSKLFDLLGAQRPILACVPLGGKAAYLIRNLGVGIIVENENPKEIAERILVLYREFAAGKAEYIYDLRPKYQYERSNVVDKLESCLLQAAVSGAPGLVGRRWY